MLANLNGGRLLLSLVTLSVVAVLPLAVIWYGGSSAIAQTGVEKPVRPTGLEVDAERGSPTVSVDWDDVAGADDCLVSWRGHGPDQDLNEGVRG